MMFVYTLLIVSFLIVMSDPATPSLSDRRSRSRGVRKRCTRDMKPQSTRSRSYRGWSPSRSRSENLRDRRHKRSHTASSSNSSADYQQHKRHKHKTTRSRHGYCSSSSTDENVKKKLRKKKKSSKQNDLLSGLVDALLNRKNIPQSQGGHNIIPEFDPQAKTQSMKDWLLKINESASVYGWSEKQVIYYSLPRLTGLAKRWYDGLTSVKHTWQEWQEKFLKAFPCEENYGVQLTEMLSRKSNCNETLEEYYYDKVRLINRCEIKGQKAVDCITHGIYDYNIRMNAQGMNFQEPEDILSYFRKISTNKEEPNKMPSTLSRFTSNIETKKQLNEESAVKKNSNLKCYNCHEVGHSWRSCMKDLLKCSNCNHIGHMSSGCKANLENKVQT